MADTVDKATRSRIMSRIRGKDTRMELAVRRELWARGMRYRKHYRKAHDADIAFIGAKVAVFLDGCFWHACPEHFVPPKSNTEYWGPKLEQTRARDKAHTVSLDYRGWRVLRYWEHELCDPDLVSAACGEIQDEVNARTPPRGKH